MRKCKWEIMVGCSVSDTSFPLPFHASLSFPRVSKRRASPFSSPICEQNSSHSGLWRKLKSKTYLVLLCLGQQWGERWTCPGDGSLLYFSAGSHHLCCRRPSEARFGRAWHPGHWIFCDSRSTSCGKSPHNKTEMCSSQQLWGWMEILDQWNESQQ